MHHAAFWSVAEPAIAIINCCIATLRPLLKIISPSRIWTSKNGSTREHVGYSGSAGPERRMRHKRDKQDEYPLTWIDADEPISTAQGDSGRLDTSKNRLSSVVSTQSR